MGLNSDLANAAILLCEEKNKRDKAFEKALLKEKHASILQYGIKYSKTVIKGRWPELEKVLINAYKEKLPRKPYWVDFSERYDVTRNGADYTREVIEGRWPEFEDIIITKGNSVDLSVYTRNAMMVFYPDLAKHIARTDQKAFVGYAMRDALGKPKFLKLLEDYLVEELEPACKDTGVSFDKAKPLVAEFIRDTRKELLGVFLRYCTWYI